MTRTSHNVRRIEGRVGFSLSELVLALGVLAIGMTMAAALFPAAMKLNEQSTKDSIGTLIAENGLAVAQALLKASDANNTNLVCLADENDASLIRIDLQHYGDPNDPNTGPPTRGFVVLGQKHPADPNGLSRLVIVSYDKRSPGNTVTAQNRIISNPTTANGVTKVTLSPAPPVGSPLIVAKNGSWAKIIEVNDSNCVLDHMIDTGGSNDAFIIVEESGSITLAKSPAMAVLVSDVMLQQ